MSPDISPIEQALYHSGCAGRHAYKALRALAQSQTVILFALIGLCVIVLLSGCDWTTKHPLPTLIPPTTPLNTSIDSTQATATALLAADKQAHAVAVAHQVSIDTAAAALPDSPARETIKGDAAATIATLGNIAPDPATLLADAQLRADAATLTTAEIRKLYEGVSKAATEAARAQAKLEAELTLKNRQLDEQQVANDFAQKRLQSEAQAQINAANQRTQEALDEAKRAVQSQQATWLNVGAFVGVGVCTLMWALGGLAGLQRGWIFGAVGLECFGLAQIVSQHWFMWACLGVALISAVIIGLWLYKQHQEGTLKASAESEVAKLGAALAPTVKTLDDAYDAAEPGVKAWLDAHVFTPLSKVMNSSQKSTIHEIRAQTPSQP